ncbi:MAG TPA: DUF3667 domain-containing protein [Flavobacterium sp.]|uniref:DUF3667 domain-containing protein n=1 Tax=Flavobacterium sp. TaxID=239 RepID=UPI002CD19E6E|nr:DUF3667 domain-containing protein [Flavobacterium sp.]HSD15303.1 DUF3667 domain-containing protein [Flavobacterium sp.]
MSKGTLREDKTCSNCGTYVEDRFCPLCGQENTETRKSFHYLFTHTLEDLVHYDSSFWETIKYLLFQPGRLTKEYLSGRRKRYVVPVKLYIFISFITFFITSFFINFDNMNVKDKDAPVTFKETPPKGRSSEKGININYSTKAPVDEKVISNSGDKVISNSAEKLIEKNDEYGWMPGCSSVRELDSVQNSLPENKRMTKLQYWFTKRLVMIAEHNTMQEAFQKTMALFFRNLPKLLFLYMPFFAFWLWVIHGKKRWFYFDHGIFTLHYFSFLLLLTSFFMVIQWLLSLSDWAVADITQGLLFIAYLIWPVIYFYKAHKRLYEESKIISFLKSTALFFINFTTFWVILALYGFYTFISIH